LDLSFNVAAVLAPEDGSTASELLAAGEASREAARTSPGEAVRWLRPNSRGDVARHRARLRELLEAKDSGAFFPVFQPQLDLRTGCVDRAEVLMRWQRADGTIAGPGEFLRELGEMGAVPAVSREVYATALAEAALCRASGFRLERLALNLDASQVESEDWSDELLRQIESSPLPPDAVEFEVSENILHHADLGLLKRGLQRLRDAAVGISLDDFGKGFASLTQIADLPIDLVKIDARLLWDAADGGRARAVIEGTVALMSRLGLPCVFEGIETPAHLDLVRRLDGRIGQGFLIGRPMQAPEFEALLASLADGQARSGVCRAASSSTTSGLKPTAMMTPSTT
jgi:EAL domain-containing protein (putative c-di-GMP-specific phosphodiesterase class I)